MNDAVSENMNQKNKPKRNFGVLVGAIMLAFLFIIIICAAVVSSQTEAAYKKAKSLMASGDYTQAYGTLKKIRNKDYLDADGLLLFCKVYLRYEEGMYVDEEGLFLTEPEDVQNWYQLNNLELPAEIVPFITSYEERKVEAEKRAREREAQELEYKITTGVPFVEMPESRIGDTILGKPGKSEKDKHRKVYVLGELTYQEQTWYYFYDKYGRLIFEARCYYDKVQEMWDYRKNPIAPYVPKKNSKTTYSSAPDVSGFSSPEDFYDWYYDEFFDYYEAEDYYYSHGGW